METVRIGFVGVGQIAKRHLDRYAGIDGAEVVAACDIDEKELAAVCDRFEISGRYTDFRKLLERDDIDAVDVCLHNNLHAPVTVEALQAGKHVYCEKPIAGSYRDGERMLQAARDTGKMLHIQLATLYSKETKAAKRLIDGGHLGRLYHARSTGYRRRGRPFVDGYGTERFVQKRNAGGGALFDMAVYHIAQILHLLGTPEVKRITGATYQETPMDPGRQKSSGYDVEELGLGWVTFADGATMDIIESWAIHLDAFGASCVVGSQGGIRLSPFKYFSNVADMTMDAGFNLDAEERRLHSLDASYAAFDSPQHNWIAALLGRAPLLPSAEIALQTMLIQEGIYMSHQRGKEVLAEEVRAESTSRATKI
jgi:predicted dehydrogenase